MNGKVTVTKERYNELVEKASWFDAIQKFAFDSKISFQEPTTKSISEIIIEMKKTGRYNKNFLNSLKSGLKKSVYFSGRR